jgi:AraC-like DNA-binding protein
VNLVAMEQKIPNFGSQVAELTPWSKVESLAPILSKSATLGELLQSFCVAASAQSKAARFSLDESDANTFFWYEGKKLIYNDIQMELYRLTSMILLVHQATGPVWRPTRLWMIADNNGAVPSCSLLRTSKYTFNSERSGFSLPSKFLSLPLLSKIHTEGIEFTKDISKDFVQAIREIIRSYVNFQNCRLEDISRVAGLPLRTLQRKLKVHGTNFNTLLNEEKESLAKNKLIDTELNVSKIASQLGYSDAAHFDRAFQRWVGMSPSEYRKSNF